MLAARPWSQLSIFWFRGSTCTYKRRKIYQNTSRRIWFLNRCQITTTNVNWNNLQLFEIVSFLVDTRFWGTFSLQILTSTYHWAQIRISSSDSLNTFLNFHLILKKKIVFLIFSKFFIQTKTASKIFVSRMKSCSGLLWSKLWCFVKTWTWSFEITTVNDKSFGGNCYTSPLYSEFASFRL